MNSTDDLVRVQHMLDAAREVIQFTAGKTQQDLKDDVMLLRAVSMSIGIVGEAASRISAGYKTAHPDIEWQPIIGMRNFIIHAYFKIDIAIIWDTITENISPLIAKLEDLLNDENIP